jgi:cardiolipin synthase
MSTLLGPTLVQGNRATALVNGDEIFPAMLSAVRSARHSIDFETYIYWSGNVGRTFGDALSERARAGVRVHLLVDWLGSQKMDHRVLDEMRSAGVRIARYRPLKWYTVDRLNNRTHRKLLVVDGRVGFTGGVGVADQWLGNAQDKDHWRDSHFRFEGPVVAQMQSAFLDNWIETEARIAVPYIRA